MMEWWDLFWVDDVGSFVVAGIEGMKEGRREEGKWMFVLRGMRLEAWGVMDGFMDGWMDVASGDDVGVLINSFLSEC